MSQNSWIVRYIQSSRKSRRLKKPLFSPKVPSRLVHSQQWWMKRETGFPRLGYIFLRLSFQLAEFFKMEKNCANIKCTRITLRMVIFGYLQCIQMYTVFCARKWCRIGHTMCWNVISKVHFLEWILCRIFPLGLEILYPHVVMYYCHMLLRLLLLLRIRFANVPIFANTVV